MKVVIIHNHSLLNAGDHAILLQTLRILTAAFPNAQFVFTFNDPSIARILLPTNRIYAAPPAWGVSIDQDRRLVKSPRVVRGFYLFLFLLSAFLKRWFGILIPLLLDPQKRSLLTELSEADLVISCGGGNFFHWFTFTGSLSLCAIIMRRRLVMLPQSIGPFHHQLQLLLAKVIVRGADLVLTRETASLRLVRDLGVYNARCEPDLAFAFPSAPSQLAWAWLHWYIPADLPATMYVGITTIDWQGQNSRFRHQQQYEQVLVEFINQLTDQGAIVVLFAQTYGPSRVEDDRLVNLRIHNQVRDQMRVFIINEPLHPAILQALYGCMDYFIATRLHSFIFATNAGVPAINIGYLSKSAGILGDMGLADRCLDIQTLTLAKLWTAFMRLQSEGLPDSVKVYIEKARQSQQMLQVELARYYGYKE